MDFFRFSFNRGIELSNPHDLSTAIRYPTGPEAVWVDTMNLSRGRIEGDNRMVSEEPVPL
ncbi:MAG: hypothetical protein MUP27_04275 [Desulfobacterales bacterium]|nr:hypothetical protein [Desulfobacterales bacterium]